MFKRRASIVQRIPIDDIEDWSKKLSLWKQDALRRLAISNELLDTDFEELLAMVKSSAGLVLVAQPSIPTPFTKEHYGSGKHQPIVLKGIANVENVNRLASKASLTFCPSALTVIYGRNGSGKSGFVRILRTACRTRVENPAKLKVLADVYGTTNGPQTADILIDAGAGDIAIQWSAGNTASPQLMQVAVFDTASAQLYVDGGNQIRYLPFGLALPHRLNAVCLKLKEKLDAERLGQVGNKVSLTAIAFSVQRETKAQLFNKSLSMATTDAQIEAATTFSDTDQHRLVKITFALSAGVTAVADVSALVNWLDALLSEIDVVVKAFDNVGLQQLTALRNAAITARQTAEVAADKMFTDEPITGVGSDTWRALWAAARDFSLSEAYPGKQFPVHIADSEVAVCVLCQQPLLPDGAARMLRFQKYMADTLDAAASKAEKALNDAIAGICELAHFRATDFSDRLEQVRKRDSLLANTLEIFRETATKLRAGAVAGRRDRDLTPTGDSNERNSGAKLKASSRKGNAHSGRQLGGASQAQFRSKRARRS